MPNTVSLPPVYAGDKTAQSHKTWLGDLVTAHNQNALDTDAAAKVVRDAAFVIYHLHGGTDGVFASGTAPTDCLKVEPTAPTSLQVVVRAGAALAFEHLGRLEEDVTLAPLVNPVSNPRVDLVQFNPVTCEASVKGGTEAASPSAPTPDDGCIPLATIYLRTAGVSIKATNDGTNHYLTDARVWVNR